MWVHCKTIPPLLLTCSSGTVTSYFEERVCSISIHKTYNYEAYMICIATDQHWVTDASDAEGNAYSVRKAKYIRMVYNCLFNSLKVCMDIHGIKFNWVELWSTT